MLEVARSMVLMLTFGWALLACGADPPRAIEECRSQRVEPGMRCDQAGQRCWGFTQAACSETDAQTVCECTSGAWLCAPAAPAQGDPVCLANAGCDTEGHVFCDDPPPADRHCQCDASGAVWSCFSICEGCPETVPNEGAACGALPAGHCQYATSCCTCVAGAFHCAATC